MVNILGLQNLLLSFLWNQAPKHCTKYVRNAWQTCDRTFGANPKAVILNDPLPAGLGNHSIERYCPTIVLWVACPWQAHTPPSPKKKISFGSGPGRPKKSSLALGYCHFRLHHWHGTTHPTPPQSKPSHPRPCLSITPSPPPPRRCGLPSKNPYIVE